MTAYDNSIIVFTALIFSQPQSYLKRSGFEMTGPHLKKICIGMFSLYSPLPSSPFPFRSSPLNPTSHGERRELQYLAFLAYLGPRKHVWWRFCFFCADHNVYPKPKYHSAACSIVFFRFKICKFCRHRQTTSLRSLC